MGTSTSITGRLVDIGDTALFAAERGTGLPLICLHGGPPGRTTICGPTISMLSLTGTNWYLKAHSC